LRVRVPPPVWSVLPKSDRSVIVALRSFRLNVPPGRTRTFTPVPVWPSLVRNRVVAALLTTMLAAFTAATAAVLFSSRVPATTRVWPV
jgi:hypothetical protein